MPASDDPCEGFEVVRTNPNSQAGANARTLTRGCASSESSDVVVEDGVLKALFEERADGASSSSASLQSAFQALFVGCGGSAVTLEQGMLEDRSEVGAGREGAIVRPIHDGSFPMGQGGVFQRQLAVMLQVLFRPRSDVDGDQIGRQKRLVRRMCTYSFQGYSSLGMDRGGDFRDSQICTFGQLVVDPFDFRLHPHGIHGVAGPGAQCPRFPRGKTGTVPVRVPGWMQQHTWRSYSHLRSVPSGSDGVYAYPRCCSSW